MANTTFKDIFKKLEKTVDKSANQAINRAVTSTRAKYAKEISSQLGVSSAKAKSRAKIYKSNKNNPGATLSIGVRTLFAASDFKTAKIKINTNKGIRIGATYTIKGQSKQIAPAGIRVNGKNSGKPVVISRISKTKFNTVRVDGFKSKVLDIKSDLEGHMVDVFEKNFNSQMKYNSSK